MRRSILAMTILFAAALAAEAAAPILGPVDPDGLRPGDRFQECDACPTMVSIPQGRFVMGAPKGEPWSDEQEEGPRHEVSVPRFAMGETEVTFDQWAACLAEGGCGGYEPEDRGWGRGALPVIFVSWQDAQAYVAWLNGKVEGEPYRLPSESEWEYAARAGTTTTFSFGETIDTDFANYNGNHTYGRSLTGEHRKQTVAAGSLPANDFGLHEMHGNLWEWNQDCWHWTYEGKPVDGSARITGDCSEAVLRGGSWTDRPKDLRSANRYYLPRDGRYFKVGFRVARTLVE